MLMKKNIYSLIFLFTLNLPLFIFIFILSIIPEDKFLSTILYTVISFFSYLIITITLRKISYKYNSKVFSKICRIIEFPLDLLFIYVRFFDPITRFQFSLLLYFSICNFIPAIIFITYFILQYPNINYELFVYLYITLYVIISILFRTNILHLIYSFHFTNANTFSSKKITLYLLSENNIKAIIYFSYFLLLILINIYNFNNFPLFKNINIDKSVLQSFATYIAFERFYNHIEKVNFKLSEFINKILRAMISELKNR